ncbi:MAG: hypothetical protein Q8R10_10570 [Pseudomonas sp.]|uniref:hypothetical protein n=1 Tax=Pseudomonas sp. TaxID=306 RepID=UPI002732A9A9|nr:hypothetical protein [Pseudomonas sp.]MDP3846849.1 hypothetical protein [Pseudomonas sp.]
MIKREGIVLLTIAVVNFTNKKGEPRLSFVLSNSYLAGAASGAGATSVAGAVAGAAGASVAAGAAVGAASFLSQPANAKVLRIRAEIAIFLICIIVLFA